MLVDANLLIYATDRRSPHHAAAEQWLTGVMNGDQRVAIPWQTIGAFLRITTHPRISASPLAVDVAWSVVEQWLSLEVVWVPHAGPSHASILGTLLTGQHLTGNLVPDAMLAALAIEHGVALCSADSDFARFPGITWINPLA